MTGVMLETGLDRKAVKRSFSRAASTYDMSSGFQDETSEEVSRLFSALMAETGPARRKEPPVLDAGCGTGTLMGLIKSYLPGARVYGSDLSVEMLNRARGKLKGLLSGLIASDCEALPFAESSFNGVVSSLTFQWVQDLRGAFSEACRVLRPDGLLVFSTLGPGTLKEVGECYPAYQGAGFRGSDEVERTLLESGLQTLSIERRVVKRRYGSFMELLETLKHIGASPPLGRGKGLSPGRALKEAGRLYAERFPSAEGGVEASYELIIAAARKV